MYVDIWASNIQKFYPPFALFHTPKPQNPPKILPY